MTARPLTSHSRETVHVPMPTRALRKGQAGAAFLAWRLRLRRIPLRAYGLAGLLPCLVCALLLDVPVARLAAEAPPDLKDVAAVFSDLGLSGYMLILSAVIAGAAQAILRRTGPSGRAALLRLMRDRALFVFAAVAVSGIAVQLIKHVVGRARPGLESRFGAFHFDGFSLDPDLASFPSGHSASIFALAAAIGLIAPRLRIPVFGLAAAVGLARIILTAHYASDIMAGAVLGIVVTLWVATLFAARSIAFTRARGILRLKGRGTILSALRTGGLCARTGA